MSELQQGVAAAVGITVDTDRDVVIVIMVGTKSGESYGVGMTPDVARHLGRTMRDMSREAEKLQDELDDLDPEEIEDRLAAIRFRYQTPPQPPV